MSRDPQINVRLPADLKDAVQKMAEDNKRSVNAEVVAALLKAVKRHNLSESIAGEKDIYLPSEIIDEIARRTALELKK